MNSITALKDFLKDNFKGDIEDSPATLAAFSHDASLLEIQPAIVLFPKDAADIKSVVHFVRINKDAYPDLSITVRSAGTCMAGGPLNDSIIVDVTRYMHGIRELTRESARVLPGTFYRDFEPEAAKLGVFLPCYTASKNLNTLGGMVGNNSAGEKTLRYGKTEDYIQELSVILSDGNEYTIRPLDNEGLKEVLSREDALGELYRGVWDIVSQNKELLKKEKPQVSKNSAGYYLWNVWDGTTFDMTKVIVGSQGTLCIVTEIVFRLVPIKPLSKLFVIFMPEISKLGDIVNDILKHKPESLESYDDSTMSLAVKFLPSMLKTMKLNFFRLVWSFIPEGLMALRGGFPKLVLLVEFSGDTHAEIDSAIKALEKDITHYGFKMRKAKNEFDSEKYWTIRRESFNLLRKHVKGRRTAPFIDDVIVPPSAMPEFLPRMRKILDDYKLVYTIAGHAGNGNFHIIPLMDMKDPRNITVIDEVSDKVYDLTLSYKGSLTAEHNDGIIRTPYLPKMFSKDMIVLFERTKKVFDVKNIFNPGKKVGTTKEYMMKHIVRS